MKLLFHLKVYDHKFEIKMYLMFFLKKYCDAK